MKKESDKLKSLILLLERKDIEVLTKQKQELDDAIDAIYDRAKGAQNAISSAIESKDIYHIGLQQKDPKIMQAFTLLKRISCTDYDNDPLI